MTEHRTAKTFTIYDALGCADYLRLQQVKIGRENYVEWIHYWRNVTFCHVSKVKCISMQKEFTGIQKWWVFL